MPALPAASTFTASSVTEADFKAQLTTLISYLSGLLDTPGTPVTALAKLGALGNAVLAKSAAHTVVEADRGKLIDCTGTWTLSLTAAATLGSFAFAVRNSGTGTITIDPNLSEQIDGAPTITLAAGESTVVVGNATAFFTVGKSTSAPADIQTFTTSGTWTKPATGKLALVECWGGGGGGQRDVRGDGGQGGNHVAALINLADLGATETVTVGAGGAGKTAATGVGAAGGNTTFGAHLTAKGGAGGGVAGTSVAKADFGAAARHVRWETAPVSVIGGNGTAANWAAGAGGEGDSTTYTGGVSFVAGNGGSGGDGTPAPTAGSEPGGGGGGGDGVNAANGAAGQCRVTVW